MKEGGGGRRQNHSVGGWEKGKGKTLSRGRVVEKGGKLSR